MHLSIKQFADDMLKMYPQLSENVIFQRFVVLAGTRAVGSLGIELEMLQRDHDQYVLDIASKLKKVETIVPDTTKTQLVTEMADKLKETPKAAVENEATPQTPATTATAPKPAVAAKK